MLPITSHIKQNSLILFFVLCFGNSFYAQEDISRFKFIDRTFNHLYYSKDSSSFINFFRKLNTLKNSKQRITIAHIGGSHVQGGIWSNTFVRHFQQEFKSTGGGYFSFPYKIAKTNGQPYARSFSSGKWKKCRAIGKDFCLPLGMSGMNISTNDSTNLFGLTLTAHAICRTANCVKVYHNFNNSFEFDVNLQENYKYERIDYSKQGFTLFKFDMVLDSIMFKLTRKDTLKKDFIVYGISMENDLNSGFFLAGLGANGASSVSFLRCSEFTAQFETLSADLVILSLGVNDTQSKGFEKEEYIEHYDSLITAIKKASPGVAILLTTTTDNFIKRKTSNKRTATAKEAMFELMEKHNVAVWDLYSIMGGYKSITKWYKNGLAARDKVHFNAKGYNILGDMMFEAVNKSYQHNQKKIN